VDAQNKAAVPSWISSNITVNASLPSTRQSLSSMSPPGSFTLMGGSGMSSSVTHSSSDRQEIVDRQRRYDSRVFTHGGGSVLKETVLTEDVKSPNLFRSSRVQSTTNLAMLAMTPSRVGIIQTNAGKVWFLFSSASHHKHTLPHSQGQTFSRVILTFLVRFLSKLRPGVLVTWR